MIETFAERVKRLRIEQGYTASDLAVAIGVSEASIRQIESGAVRSPSFFVGLRLAERLHVDPRYLGLGAGYSITERFETLEERIKTIEQRFRKGRR